MAILGIFIQSSNGLPIFKESWSSKIELLDEVDELLISGFMSAICQFANTFKKEIGYIRFISTEYQDKLGVDSILVNINEILATAFVDPYQFHDMVKLKIKWIYDKVLSKYKENLKWGRTIQLTKEEKEFCFDVLHDIKAKSIIDKRRNELIDAIDNFMNYNPDIRGISINSFDNTILFNYGIERDYLERLLYYMGRGISQVSEYEILHKPIIEEDGDSLLVCLTNPAVPIKLTDIEDTVPIYYYVITDPDCSIGPVIGSLVDILNPLIYK